MPKQPRLSRRSSSSGFKNIGNRLAEARTPVCESATTYISPFEIGRIRLPHLQEIRKESPMAVSAIVNGSGVATAPTRIPGES
jgi:hypothetical protein